MIYKAATDDSDPAHVIENDAGRWQWMIIELEEGALAPSGWQALPDVLDAPAKAKRGKIKLPSEPETVTEDTDGNSDGN